MNPIPDIAARPFRLASVIAAAAILHGCGGGSDREINPAATYESYGAAFEPSAAIPAQALLAEAESYVGRAVLLEGILRDGCAPMSCWMLLEAGEEKSIRVFLPTKADGSYDFSVPLGMAGRRAVVQGSLSHTEETAPSTYDIRATGVMVEKVRS